MSISLSSDIMLEGGVNEVGEVMDAVGDEGGDLNRFVPGVKRLERFDVGDDVE
jgi:hypothetical protein